MNKEERVSKKTRITLQVNQLLDNCYDQWVSKSSFDPWRDFKEQLSDLVYKLIQEEKATKVTNRDLLDELYLMFSKKVIDEVDYEYLLGLEEEQIRNSMMVLLENYIKEPRQEIEKINSKYEEKDKEVINTDAFGKQLKRERMNRKITLRELSIAIDSTIGYLSDIEQGILPPPETEKIKKIENFLHIQEDKLVNIAKEINQTKGE